MKRAIVVSPGAARAIDEIDAWWRANREKAPDLFADELARAFDTIATVPLAGRLQRQLALHNIRRVVLHRTKHHVYYRIVGDQVHVLVVWGAVRGDMPDLGLSE